MRKKYHYYTTAVIKDITSQYSAGVPTHSIARKYGLTVKQAASIATSYGARRPQVMFEVMHNGEVIFSAPSAYAIDDHFGKRHKFVSNHIARDIYGHVIYNGEDVRVWFRRRVVK